MGRDIYEAFPAARNVFDRAENACGLPLKKLCFEGPEDQLARTDVCQVAIFTVSAAALAGMKELAGLSGEGNNAPAYLAGLSLGEYTALYAAGAMDLESAVRLVTRRGSAMQAAAGAVPSAMICVLGLEPDAAEKLCKAAAGDQVLTCANFNCPGQVVLSGQTEACARVRARAEEFGARGAVPLKVAGAFHSPLMQPAADQLAEAIDRIAFNSPRVPVIANTDARPYDDAGQIKAKLLDQVVSPTRWQESMEYLLAQGVQKFYEVGPGRVLAGLMKRIDRQADVTCLNNRESLEKLAQVS